jgi:mannose-6-phosphate isomerase-like protein (cupin superfamily)
MSIIGPDDGDRADFPALRNRYILRGADTGGGFALIEHEILPRSLAAPIHTHRDEDEYSYVVSGRVGIQIGDDVLEAGPGELVAKPRGIPHAFWNAYDEPAVLLELISPAGFEQYFADLAPHLAGDGPPDLEALAEIRDRYGLTMDMESRPRLVKEHGLNG